MVIIQWIDYCYPQGQPVPSNHAPCKPWSTMRGDDGKHNQQLDGQPGLPTSQSGIS